MSGSGSFLNPVNMVKSMRPDRLVKSVKQSPLAPAGFANTVLDPKVQNRYARDPYYSQSYTNRERSALLGSGFYDQPNP